MTRLGTIVTAGKGMSIPQGRMIMHEGLRPVGLVSGHCCNNDACGEEGRHGEEHDGRGTEVAQHQTRGDGSQQPAYGDSNELSRRK